VADLQVSIALLLENQEEIRRALEAEGGKAGDAFRNRLAPQAQKAFDEITSAAEKAAKDVGIKFNKTKLQFETVKGDIIPQAVLDKISQSGSKIAASFAEARNAVDTFKVSASSAGREAASSLNLLEAAVTGVAVSLTQQLTNAAGASLAGLKNMVTGFMELDGELRLAAAAAGETGGYERLGSIVEKVGIDAAGTSKQVAELATSLVRAGFSVSEVEKALPGVVRGAEATGTGFEQMGNIVGNTLRGFGLEAEQVGRVTDVLVNAANSSNASIEGLGYTFEYTAPIAKALGVSLEDVAAAAGLMANAGIQGSVAGTGLRTGLQKLQEAAGGASPAVLGLSRGQERLAQTMKMIGATVTDAAGNLLPLEQVFLNLKDGLSKLSQADQVQLTNILFGDEAGSKFLSITNQSSAAISKMFSDMKNSAGSTDVARDAMAGIGLEMQQLQGTLGAIGTSIGGVLAAGLRPFIQAANAIAGVISGLPEPIKTTGSALIGMAAAAATASVGIGALNVAVASVGGWAAMRAAIASVAAVITGPLGAGTLVFAGIGAAAAVLSGHFRETDRTTKTLLQTAVGLGAFVAVLKGITIAQAAWTAATKGTGVAMAFLTALTGPSGIARVAVAAGVAAAAYYGMGQAIKVAGEETTAMADKSRAVKDEIAQLGKEIEQSKKLNVDTSDLEKLKDAKELELQQIENPLEIKLNIQKAEAQIKSLQEEKDKLGKESSASGSGVLTAQIKAAEKYRDVLKAADEGVGGKSFGKLNDSAKQFIQSQQQVQDRIQALRNQQIDLPIGATVDRAKIDKEITRLQDLAKKNDIKFKAGIDLTELQIQLEVLKAKKEQIEKPVTRKVVSSLYGGTYESNEALAKREADQKKKVSDYTRQIAELQNKIAIAQNQSVGASEQQANAAGKLVNSEQKRKEALLENLRVSKEKLDNQLKEAELGDKLMSIDKNRLSTIRELADTYLALANAQSGLTQSQFDVRSARNNRDVSVKNEEIQAIREAGQEALQYMRDRGAGQNEIAAKEREIADTIKSKEKEIKELKERGKQIEQEALAAAIDGAAKRFEIERKVLQMKQMAERMEAEAAVRASQRASLEARGKLIELKRNLEDPKATTQQKSQIGEQIKIQQQMISLTDAQVAADKEALAMKEKKFAMEKDTLALQKQQEANQFRSKAAEQGTEIKFSDKLATLDKQAGKPGANKMQWEDIAKSADKTLGIINKHNEALKKGAKNVAELAKVYKDRAVEPAAKTKEREDPLAKARSQELDAQKAWKRQMEAAGIIEFKAEGIPQSEINAILKDILGVQTAAASEPQQSGLDAVRSKELSKQEEWKKKMEAAGIIEFKAEGIPKAVTDAIIGDAVMGSTSPIVDQWFASKDGQAAMDKWRQSAQDTAAVLGSIEAAAKLASSGVDDLNDSLGEASSTPRGFQQMRDELFGPKARRGLFGPAEERIPSLQDQEIKFSATGLDQIRSELSLATGAVDAFKAGASGIDGTLSSSFTNAFGALLPLADRIRGIGTDLQGLGANGDPFALASGSLASAAINADALGLSLQTATQTSQGLNDALANVNAADSLQQAYDALKPPDVTQAVTEQATLADGTAGTVASTQALADSWVNVAAQIANATKALAGFSTPQAPARFAGGPTDAGRNYTVNELGQESFLSAAGSLSLIRAPRYGRWVAPSKGLVLPAGVTSRLDAMGAFNRGGAAPARQMAAAIRQPRGGRGGDAAALGRLQHSIDRLEVAMRSYRPPTVEVHTPSNAGLLHSMQSLR
jgi:TP901 family phage tail tape measure protein